MGTPLGTPLGTLTGARSGDTLGARPVSWRVAIGTLQYVPITYLHPITPRFFSLFPYRGDYL